MTLGAADAGGAEEGKEGKQLMDKFPDFRTIKQETLSDCGAAVAAMACGRTLHHAKLVMEAASRDGHPYYRTNEIARYLAIHGILMGLHLEVIKNPLLVDAEELIGWRLQGWPAILAVKSKRFEDADHWVLWDGRQIRDPSPHADETGEIGDHEVLELYPLAIVNDVGLIRVKERRKERSEA